MADSAANERNNTASGELNLHALVADHWDGVYRLLYSLAGNTHDADDLAQETFLRAMNHQRSFTAGTNLRAWLLRIATNAFFDLRRKQKRGPSGVLTDDVSGPPAAPERRLETQEQYERAVAALAELSETSRLVFQLRVQENLSFREIAELADTTEQSARWHMHHARTRLLEALEAEPQRPRAS